jgi:hypothetical protein
MDTNIMDTNIMDTNIMDTNIMDTNIMNYIKWMTMKLIKYIIINILQNDI